MRRPLPAPRAVRSAISRVRPAARANSRFATFAHAISSTKPAAHHTAQSAVRAWPSSLVRQRYQAEPRANGIGFRRFAHHRGEDAVQLRARLVQGHAALQPAEEAQLLAVAAGRKRIDPLRVVHFGDRCGRGFEEGLKRGRQNRPPLSPDRW